MRNKRGMLLLVGILLLPATMPVGASGRGMDDSPSLNSNNSDQKPIQGAEDPAPATGESQVENSVVKIFSTIRVPDFAQPWTKQPAREIFGTGFVIEGRRILTNAHVVLYASQVEVQGNQSSDKISAAVEFIAPGMDLAVLKLDDETFFDTHAPLPRSRVLPEVRDSVLVYGFPVGGNNLSITKGIVSRIDFTAYDFGSAGLRVQIDAAVNPGNSGGPALVEGKVIGIAFSVLSNSQNIGYIIPSEEIDLFLSDIADGTYEGKYQILDELQTLENPALRDFLKLDKSIEGLVVHSPYDDDPAYPLRKWDVITKIGDTSIDSQGNVLLNGTTMIGFSYLVQKIARNNTVPLTVVRDGKEIPIQLPVVRRRSRLIPYLLGSYPPYFILGPLVFSSASEDLVGTVMTGRSMMGNAFSLTGNPLITRRNDKPAFEGEELVIIPSPLFANPLSKGYGHPTLSVVKSVNGIDVKNLRHLVETARDSEDEYITIEFAGSAAESLVFHRKEIIDATEDILNDNGIRNLASPDMLAVWNRTGDR